MVRHNIVQDIDIGQVICLQQNQHPRKLVIKEVMAKTILCAKSSHFLTIFLL